MTTHRPIAARNDLAGLLEEGLHRLADAGEVDAACRLAGSAHAALRHDDPAVAQRFNVLLHRLTPRLTDHSQD